MTELKVRAQLRNWVLHRAKATHRTDFDDESPIITDGLLTSLDLVEFVLFIESLRGDEIDVDDLEPEVFENINAVYASFFKSADN